MLAIYATYIVIFLNNFNIKIFKIIKPSFTCINQDNTLIINSQIFKIYLKIVLTFKFLLIAIKQ